MTSRSRALRAAAGAAVLALALTACGSGSTPGSPPSDGDLAATPQAQVTSAPAADAKVIKVTINADSVDPNGAEAAVKRNQPVVLQIHAAVAGELHVHSTPEQHIAFPVGDSEITLTFAAPEVVSVEDHALDKLIVQLEVS